MRQAEAVSGAATLNAAWVGPFNLRAMINALPTRRRNVAATLLSGNRFAYVLLYNFASRMDGTRPSERIIRETSFAMKTPIEKSLGDELIGWFLDSQWAVELPPVNAA